MLRELNAVIEHPVGDTDTAWAAAMKQVLLDAKAATDTARKDGQAAIADDVLADLRHRYRQAFLCGLSVNASGADRTARALARRLRDRAADYHRHWTDLHSLIDDDRGVE